MLQIQHDIDGIWIPKVILYCLSFWKILEKQLWEKNEEEEGNLVGEIPLRTGKVSKASKFAGVEEDLQVPETVN